MLSAELEVDVLFASGPGLGVGAVLAPVVSELWLGVEGVLASTPVLGLGGVVIPAPGGELEGPWLPMGVGFEDVCGFCVGAIVAVVLFVVLGPTR